MKECVPSVIGREILLENTWIRVTRKDVSFGEVPEDYFVLELPDYVAIVARTPCGRIPLVKQYRPAVEQFTLELPAGTVDKGETPTECAVRELWEEVGLAVRTITQIGAYWADTGRLGNLQHVFLAETEEIPEFSQPELEVSYVTAQQLERMIVDGEFRMSLHISALYLTGVLPAR